MSGEKRLLQHIVALGSTGWDTQLLDQMQPGQMDLASLTARIYVVDTQTGWTAAGCMRPSDFASVAAEPKAAGMSDQQVMDAVGILVRRLGDQDADKDSAEVAACIQIAASAMTHTQTYAAALPSGLDGHWIYVIYSGQDGTAFNRPVFMRDGASGSQLMSPEKLHAIVCSVLKTDFFSGVETRVAQGLRDCGGLRLAEHYLANQDTSKSPAPMPGRAR